MIHAGVRFGAGLAGSVFVGAAVFRTLVFHPGHPAFECLSVGGLAAGIFTLVRLSRRGQALALALAFFAMHVAFSPVVRVGSALSGLLLGLGLYVVALVFDLLAERGWRFGKFLIVGPMIGGVFLALAPLTEMQLLNVFNASSLLMFRLALGMLIGEGVTLGVELADLSLTPRAGSSGWNTRDGTG